MDSGLDKGNKRKEIRRSQSSEIRRVFPVFALLLPAVTVQGKEHVYRERWDVNREDKEMRKNSVNRLTGHFDKVSFVQPARIASAITHRTASGRYLRECDILKSMYH